MENIIITVSLVIAIILISIWFIFHITQNTVSNQNINFLTLNTFSNYYQLSCNAEKMDVENIHISANPRTQLTVEGPLVCIESKNILKFCKLILCDDETILNFNETFNLNKDNFFTFFKKNESGDMEYEITFN